MSRALPAVAAWVTMAIWIASPHAAEPSQVDDTDETSPGAEDDRDDEAAVDPHPDRDEPLPEVPDEDTDGLPPDGRAHRPTLPYLDRDLLAPGQSREGARGSASVAFAKIGEDLFLDLNVSLGFNAGPDDEWRIVPRLPLRIRLIDEAPKTDDVIRGEDWDEVSDWARLLAYVQYGRWGDPYIVRYGELHGVTIGHGSLVNRYYNVIDIDHYQGGLYATLDFGTAGVEALLNDVLSPDLLVGRAYARPFSPLEEAPLPLRGMKFGFTLGADFTAPLVVDGAGGQLFAHPDHQPVVLASEVAGLMSADIEVPVFSSPHLDIVPYADFATVDGFGFGFHLGSYVNARFSDRVRLSTRLEYRFLGDGYDPGYVSAFYEIERYSYRSGEPKLRVLKEQDLGRGHSGFYFESDLRIKDALRFALVYATSGRDRGNDLLLRARLSNIGPVQLTLFFGRLGFDGFDNLWAADQTIWGTSVRVFLTDTFYLRAGVTNEWWLRHSDAQGTYFETVTNFDVGGGAVIRL